VKSQFRAGGGLEDRYDAGLKHIGAPMQAESAAHINDGSVADQPVLNQVRIEVDKTRNTHYNVLLCSDYSICSVERNTKVAKMEIADDVAAELNRLHSLLGVDVDDLLRRLLKLPTRSADPLASPPSPMPQISSGFRTREGAILPVGLELRKVYKSREYRAVVKSDGIYVNGVGKPFFSPSLAGVAVTNYNVNGWVFWDCKLPSETNWRSLDRFRQAV